MFSGLGSFADINSTLVSFTNSLTLDSLQNPGENQATTATTATKPTESENVVPTISTDIAPPENEPSVIKETVNKPAPQITPSKSKPTSVVSRIKFSNIEIQTDQEEPKSVSLSLYISSKLHI
jgi:hypothetical protein